MRIALLAVGIVLVGMTARPATAFDPATAVGSWVGTWKNKTFDVSGPMEATVTLSPDLQTLTIDWNISGLFNCGGSTAIRTLVSGVDFTADGINFQAENAAWGDATVTSLTKKKGEKITITGTTPCNLSIASWSVKAKLKEALLKGKMKIVFAAGNPKRSKTSFSATKTPLPQ